MNPENLKIARKRLMDVLGDKQKKYFSQVRAWFKTKITKEEFDEEARILLNDSIELHNQFFIELINNIEGLAAIASYPAQEKNTSHGRSSSRRHRRSSRPTSEKVHFEPAELFDYLPSGSPPGTGSEPVRYAAQELFLPEHTLVMGRFMLAAWEQSLDGTDDDSVECVMAAVQCFLKNIISVIITQRKGFKVKQNNFVYDVGSDVPNMWLRNISNYQAPSALGRTELDESGNNIPSTQPTFDEMEQSVMFGLALSTTNCESNRDRISLYEVYDVLRVHKNVIASHAIYAINMERIITMLSHSSY